MDSNFTYTNNGHKPKESCQSVGGSGSLKETDKNS